MSTVIAMMSYVYFVGIVQLVLSFIWLICAAGVSAKRGRSSLGAHLKRVAIFNVAFFVWGFVAYTACHAFTFGRAYVSHDAVLDWQPFIPFGDWVLHQRFDDRVGALLGCSLLSLRVLWWTATLVVWIGTLLTFKRFTRVNTAHAI